MIEIYGTHNKAKVFTDTLDDESRKQITHLCSLEYLKDSQIRFMPDVHAGAGCTVGTTLTITKKVCPNFVGVDIGCGMEVVKISKDSPFVTNFDPVHFDRLVKQNIPMGMTTRKKEHRFASLIDLGKLKCPEAQIDRARVSIGTLGGGNHFIEVNRDSEGNLYIVIHSGSRHLGLEIANYYQKKAWEALKDTGGVTKDTAYVEGQLYEDYIDDMIITQKFASINRRAMMDIILRGYSTRTDMDIPVMERFTTIHNYIFDGILRKGAVSAREDEKFIVPINMRDGSLICVGKGNPDWNYSAPHGAGRLMSRRQAKDTFKMDDFQKSMEGIYSSTVCKDTLDECPMAYKSVDDILSHIDETATVLERIVPIYNCKAAE